MGKAAIVHTNYPIKTEKLFCGADKGGLGFGGGGEKKWAGERSVIGKMAILKVEKWTQKSSDLLRYPQGIVELLLMAATQTCVFDLMPTSATIVPAIGIFGNPKTVYILHSDQSECQIVILQICAPSPKALWAPSAPAHLHKH